MMKVDRLSVGMWRREEENGDVSHLTDSAAHSSHIIGRDSRKISH